MIGNIFELRLYLYIATVINSPIYKDEYGCYVCIYSQATDSYFWFIAYLYSNIY